MDGPDRYHCVLRTGHSNACSSNEGSDFCQQSYAARLLTLSMVSVLTHTLVDVVGTIIVDTEVCVTVAVSCSVVVEVMLLVSVLVVV